MTGSIGAWLYKMDKSRDSILITFREWTRDLGPLRSRKSIFQHIRDIPYAIIPELIDPQTGPQEMLVCNMGSCSPKHFLLGSMFGMLGIPVKYATFPFMWNDLDYPPLVKTLVQHMPVEYHVACRVLINDEWVLVDATWDRALKKAGFVVNEDWTVRVTP